MNFMVSFICMERNMVSILSDITIHDSMIVKFFQWSWTRKKIFSIQLLLDHGRLSTIWSYEKFVFESIWRKKTTRHLVTSEKFSDLQFSQRFFLGAWKGYISETLDQNFQPFVIWMYFWFFCRTSIYMEKKKLKILLIRILQKISHLWQFYNFFKNHKLCTYLKNIYISVAFNGKVANIWWLKSFKFRTIVHSDILSWQLYVKYARVESMIWQFSFHIEIWAGNNKQIKTCHSRDQRLWQKLHESAIPNDIKVALCGFHWKIPQPIGAWKNKKKLSGFIWRLIEGDKMGKLSWETYLRWLKAAQNVPRF